MSLGEVSRSEKRGEIGQRTERGGSVMMKPGMEKIRKVVECGGVGRGGPGCEVAPERFQGSQYEDRGGERSSAAIPVSDGLARRGSPGRSISGLHATMETRAWDRRVLTRDLKVEILLLGLQLRLAGFDGPCWYR